MFGCFCLQFLSSGWIQKEECRKAYQFDKCWRVHSKDLDLSCLWFCLCVEGACGGGVVRMSTYLREVAWSYQCPDLKHLLQLFTRRLRKEWQYPCQFLNWIVRLWGESLKKEFQVKRKYTGFSEDRSLKTFDRCVISFAFRNLKCFEIEWLW